MSIGEVESFRDWARRYGWRQPQTTRDAVILPEECPEPFWHETHRYCPACSWTDPQNEDVLTAAGEIIHGAHVAWLDAAGVTGEARGDAKLGAGPCDECRALARLVRAERGG